MELVVAIGAPAFKIAVGDALSAVRLRLRPRHDAPRSATLRARQTAAVDSRQGCRSERAGLGDRPGCAHRPSRRKGQASNCSQNGVDAPILRHQRDGLVGRRKSSRISQASIISAPGDLIFTGTPAGVGPGHARRSAGRRDRGRRRAERVDRTDAHERRLCTSPLRSASSAAPRWTASTSR